jgi:hypothetical protein
VLEWLLQLVQQVLLELLGQLVLLELLVLLEPRPRRQ